MGTSVYTQRVSVNVPSDMVNQVYMSADKKGTTFTAELRRALTLLLTMEKYVAGGAVLQLVEKDGTVRELIVL